MQIGNIIQLNGYVTKQIFLQGQSLQEIENRIGYNPGRLSLGAIFCVAMQLPEPKNINLGAYSMVADHHLNDANKFGADFNNRPQDDSLRKIAVAQMGQAGSERIIKVLPLMRHTDEMDNDLDKFYPPGTGIPQWKILNNIPFKVEAIVTEYPKGRFKPLEGYTEVSYI